MLLAVNTTRDKISITWHASFDFNILFLIDQDSNLFILEILNKLTGIVRNEIESVLLFMLKKKDFLCHRF